MEDPLPRLGWLPVLLAMVLVCPGWAQEPEMPPAVSRDFLTHLQRHYDIQAKILIYNGAERYALTYSLRYQKSADIKALIDGFKDPQGQVLDLAYRNAIFIISDEPNLHGTLDLLEMFDSPSPQVQIEAKIVEITHSDDFQWGINIFFDKGLTPNPLTGELSPQIATDSALTALRAGRGLFDPDAWLNRNITPFRGGELTFANVDPSHIMDLGRIDVVLRALEDTGRGEVLSQPSILATVGKVAMIQVGEEIPVPKTQERGGTVYVTDIEWKKTGVKLEVTPEIIAEDQITLKIRPEVSFVIEFISVGTATLSPRISTRNADTHVTVANGEAIVIGGLIQTLENSDEVKFPVLGDIPVLGNLFKTFRKRNQKTEVFFFLEPHIVTNQYRRPAIYVPDVSSRR